MEDGPEYAKETERSTKLPLTSQDKALAELHETIDQFSRRLKAVLTPTPETDRASDSEKATPVQSPLADQLDTNNRTIHRATSKLRSLMERLEC